MSGIERIAAERKRQIEEEGFTAERDDFENDREQLAKAAACYALPDFYRFHDVDSGDISPVALWEHLWPWEMKWWKPTPENRIRELEKAGVLIAAEIDRLIRLEAHDDQ